MTQTLHKAALSVSHAPPPEAFAAIFAALDGFNTAWAGPANPQPLAVLLHGPDGREVVGGLWGHSMYRWFSIQMLYVPPALRETGNGTALVRAAEDTARARGCLGAQVDTFSFQARGFYERLGYRVFATLPDLPPGHACHYLARRF